MIHVTTYRVKYDNESGQILASLPLEHVSEKKVNILPLDFYSITSI